MHDSLIFVIPVFTLFLLVEFVASWRARRPHVGYETRDTLASLAMGVGSVAIGFGTDVLLASTIHALNGAAPWSVPLDAWWGWVAAMLLVDFLFYWAHRAHHEVRFFWAAHVNHHSSQHYNLSTALRQSWTELLTIIPFLALAGLAGFTPEHVLLSFALNLFYQFFTHTELVDRLGPLEWVMNTPSHHRVHHGSNLQYLDKNYAGILIIWDRMFGTFEPEDEPVVYGLTTNISSFNPLWIAFHEWVALGRDAARRPAAALAYMFRPPGWSPDGSTKTVPELRAEAAAGLEPAE